MAENINNQQQDDSKEYGVSYIYKFMTNIIADARHRTKYVKELEKVTMDAQISISRLIICITVAVLTTMGVLYFIFTSGERGKYIAFPLLLALVCILVLILNFALPSRSKSMLESAVTLVMFTVSERFRRKGKKATDIQSLGIRKYYKGYLYLDDDRIAAVYKVEGQLSRSVLPAVADATAAAKKRYLIARPENSQETLITSIKEVDVTSQLDTLINYYQAYQEDNETHALFRDYANMTYRYIDENMSNIEYAISQILIISNTTMEGLRKHQSIFEKSCNDGLYAGAILLDSKKQIIDELAPLTLISKKGAKLHAKNNEKKSSIEKR